MEVGLKIKEYLKAHGISQAYLCRKTGIDQVKLNLSLNGHRRLPYTEYEQICGVLGVGTDCFLSPRIPEEA